jgi:hypothetical protein
MLLFFNMKFSEIRLQSFKTYSYSLLNVISPENIAFFCQIWFANCFPRLQNDFEQFLPPKQSAECFSASPWPKIKEGLEFACETERVKENVSAHHQLSTQFFQLEGGDGGSVVGVVRPRGAAAFHFLQLPSQFLHLGHRHAQLLLFFIEKRSD